jgi:hypothetical protein
MKAHEVATIALHNGTKIPQLGFWHPERATDRNLNRYFSVPMLEGRYDEHTKAGRSSSARSIS